MATKKTPQPTNAELDILRVLWKRGPSTVRQVMESLSDDRPMGYTTVLKFMQIMTDKGLLVRDERQMTHIYRARASADKTRGQLVNELVNRAFEGSAQKLVMQALSARKVSVEELAEIRKLLDELEGET